MSLLVTRPRAVARVRRAVLVATVALAAMSARAHAQTDYYNLDRGRPLRVEDALPIERHAFEWQLAPARLSGGRGSGSTLELEPELAWGLWPRTQVELGIPLARLRRGSSTSLGGAGIDVAILHALNTESTTLPAFALAAHALLPAGPLGPSRAIPRFTAIATRTFTAGRLHLNASATPGRYASTDRVGDASRWEVGVAADHAFVFQALLVGADLVARRPLVGDAALEWSAATGVRYQVGPRLGVDVGVGRGLSAGDEWFVTFGSALSLALLHRFGGVR
jgi:hypothetical protein